MKKILIIILMLGLIVASGCGKTNDSSNLSQPHASSSSLEPEQSDLNTNKADSKYNNSDKENVDNAFFFKDSVSELNYNGRFLFDEPVEKDVKLHINEVTSAKSGRIYELKLDSIDGVSTERLSLGYFCVQKDKIYKIEPTKENLNKLIRNKEMPNDSVVVCQDKEIKDTLSNEEHGWHHYLKVDGNKREYYSYNNLVGTGYYESFIWEKDKGLINYRSGYGAERDSIEIQLINVTPIAEKSDDSLLETWVGNYSFSEFVPPDQNMFYGISIYKEEGNYYADISIDGFQTIERLRAKVDGDKNSIKLRFDKYLPDNRFQPYEVGDILLSFEKSGSDLNTLWGKIEPIDKNDKKSGSPYFELIP
ncbi:DUF5991 domain-containing protein [Pseudobacteroides cellulosolvens]|uniref:Lipoprotein n=2 Tax=Pseudobacteroides cellulosolvens TaxID=35825 RepID=A0A0L6JJJ7_9FIRM|nr:DUF5991 domain-containing protein [Pseudobacteroides cellulosolvens]KNY25863.1 hypothetical protein Bccel_1123 [Pseudobacteroides cellulosolvens ATCC 35603 = DSM 2933]